jgi:RHS repeat-associated protein
LEYYSNDMASLITRTATSGQLVASQALGLDATGTRYATTLTAIAVPGLLPSVNVAGQTNHYVDNSDSPAWSGTTAGVVAGTLNSVNGFLAGVGTGSGNLLDILNAPLSLTWTRYIDTPDGGLGATVDNLNKVLFPITNLHGDVVGNVGNIGTWTLPPTSVTDYKETDEFGVPGGSGDVKTPYQWLGSEQRSNDDIAGLIQMGVRLYNPTTGRFLSVDPVPGGNPNAYTYPLDPINMRDLDGNCSWCNKLKRRLSGPARSAGKYIYNHGQIGVGGCYGVCGSLGFQGGHFSLAVGGVGFGAFGKAGGWSSAKASQQSGWSAVGCASATAFGGCAQSGRSAKGRRYYSAGYAPGMGFQFGGMHSLLDVNVNRRARKRIHWWG